MFQDGAGQEKERRADMGNNMSTYTQYLEKEDGKGNTDQEKIQYQKVILDVVQTYQSDRPWHLLLSYSLIKVVCDDQ